MTIQPWHAITRHYADGSAERGQIRGTHENIRKYYVGHYFDFGHPDGPERMVKCVAITFYDDTTPPWM